MWRAIDEERVSLAGLLDSLGDQEWETPSLCAGWRVRDVAAHLTLAQMGPLPSVVAAVRARGNFNRMIYDTAVRQARLPVSGYAPRLLAMAGSRRKAPGVTYLEPLIDVLVHGQDIAIPLSRIRPVPVRAAVAAADRVWPSPRPGEPGEPGAPASGSGSVTSIAASASAACAAASGSVASGLMPVTARPAAIAPRATAAQAGVFGARRASTSPGANPRPASSAATRLIRAASAP